MRCSRCFTACACVLFVIGCFPFPAALLPPFLVGSCRISAQPLHSLICMALVSSSRSFPLRFVHNLHSRNFIGSLTVYHHPRSSGSSDPSLSCHQSLGIRIMSLSLCSIVSIRVSVLSSKVCSRSRWALLVHPLTDTRNRISVSG